MIFSSFEFIFLFLPLTLAGYFLLGRRSVRAANGWLLFSSFFFYAWWDVRFLPLLAASILLNYLTGLAQRNGSYSLCITNMTTAY